MPLAGKVRRTRLCLKCGHKYKTVELLDGELETEKSTRAAPETSVSTAVWKFDPAADPRLRDLIDGDDEPNDPEEGTPEP
jgi:hypothetical protein